MKFDADRFSQLAGLPNPPKAGTKKPLTEGRTTKAKQGEPAEIKELRRIIRREAKQMVESMKRREVQKDTHTVRKLQKTRSLTEAIAMGFAGPGFGGKSFALGGPMTSARSFASLKEGDWTMSKGEMIEFLVDQGHDEADLEGKSDDELANLISGGA